MIKRKKSYYEIIRNMRINLKIVKYWGKIIRLSPQVRVEGKEIIGDDHHFA